MPKTQKMKASNKHASNLHRHERKSARHKEALRQRAKAGDEKAERMLYESRTKAGKRQGYPRWERV